jgi:hypothetical protein
MTPTMPEATRDRERHLGVNGEKVRAGLILDTGTNAKIDQPRTLR